MTIDVNKILQHEIYIQRLASGTLSNSIYPSLKEISAAVIKILGDQYPNLTRAKVAKLSNDIRNQIFLDNGWSDVTQEMTQMAIYEASFQAAVIGGGLGVALSVPEDKTIASFVNKSIMSLSSGKSASAGTWAQYVRENKTRQADLINGLVIKGYTDGEALGSITRKVRDSFDGILKSEAETLVRTGFNHYASQASQAMEQSNLDILEEYYYLVTFDSRTSDICINADIRWNKKRFSTKDNAPQTPLHFSCRTRRMAVPKDWQPSGDRASVGGQSGEEAQELYDKRKAREAKAAEEQGRSPRQIKYRGKRDSKCLMPSLFQQRQATKNSYQSNRDGLLRTH
jgi:SPP1 gp7 family putative phage head morphogenesis protein